MRTSVLLAAAALCLGAVSSVHAQGIQFNPYGTPSTPLNFNPYGTPSTPLKFNAYGGIGASIPTPPSGASQARFPSPGQMLSGPARLIDLLPGLHGLSNTHYVGYSVFPTQTDQYLAQFGFQRLK